MRLLNVDDIECDAIAVGVVQPIQLGNLPAEGRSSVAAEDQDDGPLAPLVGERDGAGVAG